MTNDLYAIRTFYFKYKSNFKIETNNNKNWNVWITYHLINNICINVRPNDAKKKVELITQQLAAQKITQKEVLPIEHCILEEIESNDRAIVITVTHVSI